MRKWLWLLVLLAGCDDADGGPEPVDAGEPVDMAAPDQLPDMPALDQGAADLGSPDPCAPSDPQTWRAHAFDGRWQMRFSPQGDWTISAPHAPDLITLSSPPRCVDGVPTATVARHTGEPRITNLFGAFRIEFDPVDEVWPATPPIITTDQGVTFSWPDAEVELRFEPYPGGGLWMGLRSGAADGGRLTIRCGREEGFFGLGTQVVGPDLRGRTYPLWTQEQGNGKPENGQPFPLANIPEAAYAPMGVWHAASGWSAVIGHDAYSELDVCETVDDRLQLRSHGAMPSLVLMPGDTIQQRMAAITSHTGRPMTPPDWVLGPWNDTVGGPERLEEMATQLRALDIPSSAIWTEDWIGGAETPNGYRLSYA